MRFSVFLVGRSTAPEQDRFVMQSLIDHARQAEDRGFDAVFMPDHHFTGYAPMSSDPFGQLTHYFTRYRDALLNAGHSDEVVNHCLSWTTHTWQCVHIAPTDEQAREEMLQIMGWYQQAIDREYEYNKRAEEFSGVTLHRHPDCFSEEWIKTWCLYGSPETVAEELERHQQLGIGNVLLGFTNGPLTEERLRLSQQSISLFADQILPRFR